MNKIYAFTLIFVLSLSVLSCKSEKKKDEKKPETTEKTAAYSLKTAKNTISFTAYKTSGKLPVKGQFQKVDILAGGEGKGIKEAIHNAEFSIPIRSIFTKDSSRDFKIKKFFFGVMHNTKLLSGKLVIENDSMGYTTLKMNNLEAKIPFKYTVSEKTFTMDAILNISDFGANKALESLNEACKDLHKGADGVSKTWDDVALNIVTEF